MNILKRPPYNIQTGQMIVLRARAHNKNGWSEPSRYNNDGIVLKSVPPKIGRPFPKDDIRTKSNEQHIHWEPVYEGADDIYYTLYWSTENVPSKFTLLHETKKAKYTV